jgi:hypothetical protein
MAGDYIFSGLRPVLPPGTTLFLTNNSNKEVHTLVALRIPESEPRPVAELLRLPEAELERILGTASPTTMLIAPPGQPGRPYVGDGSIDETGRYAIICVVPTGADPTEYLRAAQASTAGPPQVAGGPPHFENGMYAELRVVQP